MEGSLVEENEEMEENLKLTQFLPSKSFLCKRFEEKSKYLSTYIDECFS